MEDSKKELVLMARGVLLAYLHLKNKKQFLNYGGKRGSLELAIYEIGNLNETKLRILKNELEKTKT